MKAAREFGVVPTVLAFLMVAELASMLGEDAEVTLCPQLPSHQAFVVEAFGYDYFQILQTQHGRDQVCSLSRFLVYEAVRPLLWASERAALQQIAGIAYGLQDLCSVVLPDVKAISKTSNLERGYPSIVPQELRPVCVAARSSSEVLFLKFSKFWRAGQF